MKAISGLVFDEIISGAGTTWYTAAALYDGLGQTDFLGMQACFRGVTGTSPTATIQVEHSADGQNWLNAQASPEISTAIANDTSFNGLCVFAMLFSYVRLRISLGGTSPQCFLKVYVTGRINKQA
jgi:hypothetical protein